MTRWHFLYPYVLNETIKKKNCQFFLNGIISDYSVTHKKLLINQKNIKWD